jgi:hypothetical protein
MIILGFLLLLAATGLSFAAIQANRSLFEESAGAVAMFGYSVDVTIGEVFLVGASAGALALLGLVMIFGGVGRGARRRVAARRDLRRQDEELRDSQRSEEAEATQRAKEEKVTAREQRRAAAAEERAAQHEATEEREEELTRR